MIGPVLVPFPVVFVFSFLSIQVASTTLEGGPACKNLDFCKTFFINV